MSLTSPLINFRNIRHASPQLLAPNYANNTLSLGNLNNTKHKKAKT